MQISEEGKQLIKKFEGCELEAYKCSAGVWTIGYGRTKNVKENIKKTTLGLSLFKRGHKPMIRNTKENNRPKPLLLTFNFINNLNLDFSEVSCPLF